jgi:hypothetical protein
MLLALLALALIALVLAAPIIVREARRWSARRAAARPPGDRSRSRCSTPVASGAQSSVPASSSAPA